MPNGDLPTGDTPAKSGDGETPLQAATLPIEVTAEPVLPTVVPPQTKAPIQFNQQVNLSIQQIPTTAWDRLSPDQVVAISKMIIEQIDATDKRHFDYAMDQVKRLSSGKKIALACGSLVSVAGFAATAYLSINNHELVALAIALPLATVIAMIVGNRFLG
jgi:acetamidase/formamidase